jgi:hypothetical protein
MAGKQTFCTYKRKEDWYTDGVTGVRGYFLGTRNEDDGDENKNRRKNKNRLYTIDVSAASVELSSGLAKGALVKQKRQNLLHDFDCRPLKHYLSIIYK